MKEDEQKTATTAAESKKTRSSLARERLLELSGTPEEATQVVAGKAYIETPGTQCSSQIEGESCRRT